MTTTGTDEGSFTAEERAAMKERAAEVRKARKRGSKADREQDLLEKIAEMPPADRALAERVHAIVREHAPTLTPRTWYGQPAYAKDGKVVCFFQAAAKFGTRYATLGFNDVAELEDGTMWPTAFALTDVTPADEKRIAELVRRVAG
ncbi:iron chaperone [Cellulomonas sp. NPDC057328]|uniref:iron chaperone n=1 Tax=Cellulomonas sp. NPDC057328 TaxID=3346101 RepID=UPI00363F94A4